MSLGPHVGPVNPPSIATGLADDPEMVRAVGREIFGAAFPLAEAYAALLAGRAAEWGLLGPREAGRVWSRHIFNSAALAPLIRVEYSVADVGSGAGLPGVPLAIARNGSPGHLDRESATSSPFPAAGCGRTGS